MAEGIRFPVTDDMCVCVYIYIWNIKLFLVKRIVSIENKVSCFMILVFRILLYSSNYILRLRLHT